MTPNLVAWNNKHLLFHCFCKSEISSGLVGCFWVRSEHLMRLLSGCQPCHLRGWGIPFPAEWPHCCWLEASVPGHMCLLKVSSVSSRHGGWLPPEPVIREIKKEITAPLTTLSPKLCTVTPTLFHPLGRRKSRGPARTQEGESSSTS